MVWAEFEEKEFEIAFTAELGGGKYPAPIFSSGVVAEKILGYDAVADPHRSHQIWKLLQLERPKGVRLFPDYWQAGREPLPTQLPVSPVSIIFQYKRPEFLRGGTAKQWSQWRRPYFRFRRSDDQHTILRRIETKLGSQATVRYASPAFYRRGEYESAVLQRQILNQTGFVTPTSLGSHKVWTYREPGSDGFPNPIGKPQRFDSFENLFVTILSASVAQEVIDNPSDLAIHRGFEGHLVDLAAAISFRQPRLRSVISAWERNIRAAEIGFSELELQQILQLATVQTTMVKIGATWHITSR